MTHEASPRNDLRGLPTASLAARWKVDDFAPPGPTREDGNVTLPNVPPKMAGALMAGALEEELRTQAELLEAMFDDPVSRPEQLSRRSIAMDALTLSVAAAVASSMAALVSAATALLAFRHQRRTTRPSVEVSASIARVFFPGATDWGDKRVAIEVVNTGLFAVDVRSVGVIGKDGQEGVLMSHKDLLGQPVLPKRLEAQSSITIAGDVGELRKWEAEHGLRSVWVRTAAGTTFRARWTVELPHDA